MAQELLEMRHRRQLMRLDEVLHDAVEHLGLLAGGMAHGGGVERGHLNVLQKYLIRILGRK